MKWLCVALLFGSATGPLARAQSAPGPQPMGTPLSVEEQRLAQEITRSVSSTEWLGALAPVAISPFFGLTCLSGWAMLAGDHLAEDHYLRGNTALKHPMVFLTFLTLTILTSVPRFSKVSKPFAQASDQMETYSTLIILLVVRVIGALGAEPATEEVAMVYQAGFLGFSFELLLMVATVINLLVINSVRFFFEMLIWITPVPFIDAIFETANKACCAGLAAVYAFSPTLATLINLTILAGCLVILGWVKRREVYYRTILVDFLYSWRDPRESIPDTVRLFVFPLEDFHGLPAYGRCELTTTETGWRLQYHRWWRAPLEYQWASPQPEVERGLLLNKLTVDGARFTFGRRFNRRMTEFAARFQLAFAGTDEVSKPTGSLADELAT